MKAGRPFGSVPLVVKSSFRAFAPCCHVYSYSLVKLFSLLLEPYIIVFPVYGEPKPARPVLVGFELQDDIVGFESMIIPY